MTCRRVRSRRWSSLEAGSRSGDHVVSEKRTPQPEVVDNAMAEVLRGMTERQRLEIGFGMWRSARDMIRRVLRHEHPDWTEEEIARETARRLLHGDV